jgi:hypothetical protein
MHPSRVLQWWGQPGEGAAPWETTHKAFGNMNTTEKVARLQALRVELLAITTASERRTYGDLGRNLQDLITDARIEAEQEVGA